MTPATGGTGGSSPTVASSPLTQTVDIETPELVIVSYTVAGVGSRTVAALIDYAICIATLIVFAVVVVKTGSRPSAARTTATPTTAWVVSVLTLMQFVVLWLYYVLFEALMDGQTPGKRLMRLRVVREGGLSLDFAASAVRNLVRIVDMQPGLFYATGLISVIASSRSKRLGDYAAGTLVLKEDFIAQPMTSDVPSPAREERAAQPAPLQLATQLADAEYEVLDRFVQRRMHIDPVQREILALALAERFRGALQQDPHQLPIAQIVRLHESERLARARGIAARGDTGAARERYAIVSASARRWSEFASRLRSAQRRGLASLGETGVREFARDYRELTSDLARLRTATRGVAANDVFYLNRLVANAHSLLYRGRSLSLRRVVEYLAVDVPREIRRSWRPIALATMLLFAPMAIALRAVTLKPAVAEMLVPPGMFDRAENGIERARRNTGYIEAPEMIRPVLASSIVANNIQVSFLAFATGMTGGVMTAWVLLSNGVSFGAVLGLYESKGILDLLLKFVAPHGVLELTAIVISGAAGFLLAAGMLLPGDLTRGAALARNAQRAIRLVAGAALLLVIAGSIEGFVSPIPDWTLTEKTMVSAATAVLLALYLYRWPTTALRPTARRAT